MQTNNNVKMILHLNVPMPGLKRTHAKTLMKTKSLGINVSWQNDPKPIKYQLKRLSLGCTFFLGSLVLNYWIRIMSHCTQWLFKSWMQANNNGPLWPLRSPDNKCMSKTIEEWHGKFYFLSVIFIVETQRNGILLPKLFWHTVRKLCSMDWEKLLEFEAEGREFAKFLRSLEQFIQTVKGQNNFW